MYDDEYRHIAKGRRLQGKGQKNYYWYVVVSAVKSVLTFLATAITTVYLLILDLETLGVSHSTENSYKPT
jgi:hypothetical protein